MVFPSGVGEWRGVKGKIGRGEGGRGKGERRREKGEI
jgi:hypothetical protein